MVVIHHYGYNLFPFCYAQKIFHSGNLAVSYFFVLSGFVLYISYHGRQIAYADFLRRRLGRIAPVYWLALALFLVVSFTLGQYVFTANLLKQILYSALFIQAWFPAYALCLNSPAWTISVEMLFYLSFPLLLMMQQRSARAFAVATVVVFAVSQAVHMHYAAGPLDVRTEAIVFFNPLIHISQFMLGMAGGYIFRHTTIRPQHVRWAPLSLLALALFLIALRPDNISYHAGLIAPVFLALILSIAITNPRPLNARWLVFLGEISYGIYILQFPVHDFMKALNTRLLHLPEPWFFYATLLMLILTAAVSYTLIEAPVRRWVNRSGRE
jgi:peptidoglycan/LPS O-acetylase OafA/YrhL